MEYGIVTPPSAMIFQEPCEEKEGFGGIASAIADEALQGMGVLITGRPENGYLPVLTHYGYSGFMRREELCTVSLSEIKAWEASPLAMVCGACADVLSIPRVQGARLATLFKGSLVEATGREEGWTKIRMADGRSGYIRSEYLSQKRFSQSGLWEEALPQAKVQEADFRRRVVKTALGYLGAQYRWGGKTPQGIDCSGLASMCYMINGLLIYRDAKLMEGYPVQKIAAEDRKAGDLLYFPGHIALYMGNERYIHSTGKAGGSGVIISSLNPRDRDCRQDLAESLYAVGSVF